MHRSIRHTQTHTNADTHTHTNTRTQNTHLTQPARTRQANQPFTMFKSRTDKGRPTMQCVQQARRETNELTHTHIHTHTHTHTHTHSERESERPTGILSF